MGWLVKGRVVSLFLLEITNHPVCAVRKRIFLLMAQPPLLETGGESARFSSCHRSGQSPEIRRLCALQSLVTNQFSIFIRNCLPTISDTPLCSSSRSVPSVAC